jgi:hypothetical protein
VTRNAPAAKLADLPVEHSTRLLELEIPPALLATADEMIE